MLRVLPLILILGVVGSATYAFGRTHRHGAVSEGRHNLVELAADRDRLAAQLAVIRSRLADAEAATHAAWDAAADHEPARVWADTADIDRLLADPLSGVHRVGA
jgi:hypothetical protein